MTFRVLLFAYRRPDLSPEDFKQRYETVHLPLVKDMSGTLFPLLHVRRYVSRQMAHPLEGGDEITYDAEMISGEPSDVMFDAITEMTFASRQDFYNFAALLNESSNAAKIAADCAEFLDTAKGPVMIVLGDLCQSSQS